MVRVIGDDMEIESLIGRKSDFWPDKYPCVRCGKDTGAMLETCADPRILQAFTVRDLSPKEAFAALMGLGVPEEQQCSLASVSKLFQENRIVRVAGEDVPGAARAVVDYLEFQSGARVYFGASPSGAVVYRIAPPPAYASQVTHG